MSSGSSKQHYGSSLGTAALLEVRTVPFRPRKVVIRNVGGGPDTGVWQEGMADDSVLKTIAAGTTTLVTSNGIIPLSDGFSIGTDADLNVAGELIHWEAHE